jgi:DNA repair exonuclease SbcCD ATPase subunit
MNLIKLKNLTLRDFGPFVGVHQIELPESGLCLVKGRVTETGDGSGAGKSFLLKAISHLFGGCLDPGTELQSWYSEEPPEAHAVIEVSNNDVNVKRRKGLSIFGDNYKEPVKGKSAEPELDRLFSMDEKSRALVTYRGQGQPGLFLSLSDEKKKAFLATLLGLEAYERVAKSAQEKASELETQLGNQKSKIEAEYDQLVRAKKSLELAEVDLQDLPKVDKLAINELRSKIELTKLSIKESQQVIDSTKTKYAQELEAVLITIRAKSSAIYQRQEPVEVTALKNELEKQRTRLDKCKEHDLAAKLAVEKERNDYRVKIKELENFFSQKPRVEAELKQANGKVSTLLAQKCSECKRIWDGEEYKKSLETQMAKVDASRVELKRLDEFADLWSEATCLLGALKDPEPHPAGKAVVERIAAINAEIVATRANFERTKRQDISTIEQEEKTTKAEFGNKLAQELLGLVLNNTQLQNTLEHNLSDDRKLSGTVAQLELKNAVVSERRSLVTNLEASYDTSVEKKAQLEKSYWLEKDVVSLVGRTGFLSVIVEEVLVEVSSIANDILSQVANVRHLSIDFETEKTAETTGNTVARIVPVIYVNGRRVSFNCGISGGQKVSVELAVDLAVGEVISRRKGSWPGFLLLDESLDGLGDVAKESILSMLKNHCGNRLILVIDHNSTFQGLFDNIIEVVSEDGKSRIK